MKSFLLNGTFKVFHIIIWILKAIWDFFLWLAASIEYLFSFSYLPEWFKASLVYSFCFALLGWGVINIGIQFEVKIKGEAYGFTIGGMSQEEVVKNAIVSSYNCSERVAEFMISYNEIHEDSLELYLSSVFPQYQNGVINKHDNFAFITLYDRVTIRKGNLKYYYDPELAQNTTTVYNVVFHPFALKTAFGHN